MDQTVAGLRSTRRNRQTKQVVSVYDGEAAGMDTEAGRWQVVCEAHGTVSSFTRLSDANSQASVPLAWCEECMAVHDEMENK